MSGIERLEILTAPEPEADSNMDQTPVQGEPLGDFGYASSYQETGEKQCKNGAKNVLDEPLADGLRVVSCDAAAHSGQSPTPTDKGGDKSCLQGNVNLSCGPGEDSSRLLNGNVAMQIEESLSPGHSVGEQLHMPVNEFECLKPAEVSMISDCGAIWSSGGNLDDISAGGPQVYMDLFGSQTSEPMMQNNSVALDSIQSGSADESAVVPDCGIPGQIFGEQDQFNLPDNFTDDNAKLSKGAVNELRISTPTRFTGEQELKFVCQSLHNEPSEEKNQTGFGGVQDQLIEPGIVVSDSRCAEQHDSSEENAMQNLCKCDDLNVHGILNKAVAAEAVDVVLECAAGVTGNSSIVECTAAENSGEGVYHIMQSEHPGQNQIAMSEPTENKMEAEVFSLFNNHAVEPSLQGNVSPKLQFEQSEDPHQNVSNTEAITEQARFAPISEPNKLTIVQSIPAPGPDISQSPVKHGRKSPWHGKKADKTSPASVERKYPMRSSVASSRVLRSRLKEKLKGPDPSRNTEHPSAGGEGLRKSRKRKRMNGKFNDEFSKMRKHLRYLLHRIHYAQNLIDAYSSEGWRGLSLEKLRPEKELQHAKSDINRSKTKIRDLFQRLDSLSAEGKFPESLFDSEGQIDSEDIFCVKCGCKDTSADNDIILCDGACDRGFHQFCLEPPLRTEEIPPDDEGWLCPACDCRVDCIDLLNDSQGTKLSIGDSWEKVFPEAVAAVAGDERDVNMELPSDDSEDNDYDPDRQDVDKEQGNQSTSDSSDSSDFSSASEDLGAICSDGLDLGLPSEDSDDNDYDPDAPAVDAPTEEESSSSDFTSASENLGDMIEDEVVSRKDGQPVSLEPEGEQYDTPPVSGRRCVERLDYKKLYVETYGDASSNSSEDEEWMDMVAPRRKNGVEGRASVSSNGAPGSADGASNMVVETRSTQKGAGKRRTLQSATGLLPERNEGSPRSTSTGRSTKRMPYKRLGEAVTQKLHESFKENQYPDNATKLKLAEQLGLEVKQVRKWFENARWSFNHPLPGGEASITGPSSKRSAPSLQKSRKTVDHEGHNPQGNTEVDNQGPVLALESPSKQGTQADSTASQGGRRVGGRERAISSS